MATHNLALATHSTSSVGTVGYIKAASATPLLFTPDGGKIMLRTVVAGYGIVATHSSASSPVGLLKPQGPPQTPLPLSPQQEENARVLNQTPLLEGLPLTHQA